MRALLRFGLTITAATAVLLGPTGAHAATSTSHPAGDTSASVAAAAPRAVAGRSVRSVRTARTARPARPAARSLSGLDLGVQFHGTWSDYTPAQRAKVLDQFAKAGVTTVRIDVGWASLQPAGPDSYDAWQVALVDDVMAQLRARGMTALVTLWTTPGWANGGQGTTTLPNNPADYARAAAFSAARWGTTVRSWEVWNEPNSADFMTGADPAAYVRLLRAAYPAFKAGDGTATVVFGGVSYNDDAWISAAYAAGAAGSFDIMATHPYMGIADASPQLADDGSQYTLRHLSVVRDLMVRNGDGAKPMWLTEFGWSTHANSGREANWDRGVSKNDQARYLTDTATLLRTSYPYVKKAFWYSDRDDTSGRVQQDNYGLLHRDLSAKPALKALAALRGRGTAVTVAVRPLAAPAGR